MLNQEQIEASRAGSGYSLILAGAGTGKTSTLTAKVLAVVEEGSVFAGKDHADDIQPCGR